LFDVFGAARPLAMVAAMTCGHHPATPRGRPDNSTGGYPYKKRRLWYWMSCRKARWSAQGWHGCWQERRQYICSRTIFSFIPHSPQRSGRAEQPATPRRSVLVWKKGEPHTG